MKKYFILFVLSLGILFNSRVEVHAYARTSVEFNLFFDALSPYGDWLRHPALGYVWRPIRFEPDRRYHDRGNLVWTGYGWVSVSSERRVLSPVMVEPDWRPYQHGHWVWSDDGWTWFSYEPWGWATDHYGRWTYTHNYGWVWIPGTVWGPAWVSWHMADDYVGWSPLPPDEGFFMSIGIKYNFSNIKVYAASHFSKDIQPDHCVFVPSKHFLNTNVKDVALPSSHNLTIIKKTNKIVNVNTVNTKVVNYGPDVNFVEKFTKVKVKKIKMIDGEADENIAVRQIGNINKLEKDRFYVFRPQVIRRGNEVPRFKEKWTGQESIKYMEKRSKPQGDVFLESENTFSRYKIKEIHKSHKGPKGKKEMNSFGSDHETYKRDEEHRRDSYKRQGEHARESAKRYEEQQRKEDEWRREAMKREAEYEREAAKREQERFREEEKEKNKKAKKADKNKWGQS